MKIADQNSWKTLPLPLEKRPLGFTGCYNAAEAIKMKCGLIPGQMEDKWFVYFQEDWLYFLRSWTGACIYALRLEESPMGVCVVDSWVNRDKSQYKLDDDEYDRKLVGFLIDNLLLDKSSPFPRFPGPPEPIPGVNQHSIVGRNYPETEEGG
ncbi:MAG: hypothetical protein IPO40_12770 [Fibrobacteres bacterium]|nr:hypothetical protein [Fibrobacterota bacterium]